MFKNNYDWWFASSKFAIYILKTYNTDVLKVVHNIKNFIKIYNQKIENINKEFQYLHLMFKYETILVPTLI